MRAVPRLSIPRSRVVVAGVLLLCALGGAYARGAEQVLCHYTYGGETKTLAMPPLSPAASPYAVKAIDIGSFFHFRVVFEKTPADSASIKVYTYADRDDGPLLIHQASFPYPPPKHGAARFGFSGLHFVYEPMRDGELQYWCELSSSRRNAP